MAVAGAFGVIMAGGAGTRFWPLSRRGRPKQLLALGGDKSLLRATTDRLIDLVPPENVLVVTSESLADATAAELSDVPAANILREPAGRNTAPCVGWAAAHVRRRDPEGVMVVLPADHHIGDMAAYRDALELGIETARAGDLVTIGIKPTRPETGYGYLEVGEQVATDVHRARRFVEKPNRQRAEQFLAAASYLWNSGMFFFRADVILDAIRAHLPGLSAALDVYDAAAKRGEEMDAVRRSYATLPSVSIDHGVMEKATRVLVIPASFAWSDLGSWSSVWELAPRDAHDNAAPEDAVMIDAQGCYAEVPKGKVVALVGVRDLVVVDTGDALLVVPRQRGQDVREVVAALLARRDDAHL